MMACRCFTVGHMGWVSIAPTPVPHAQMLLTATAKQPLPPTCKEGKTQSRHVAIAIALIALMPRCEDKGSWPACMQPLN